MYKQRFKNRRLALLLLIAVLSMLMVVPALAGEGDGSGGGQGVPLGLDYSSPANGQGDVALQPLIKLTFNKNVINLAIRGANKNCFSLVSAAGIRVPIEVIMADDQIQPEEKRNVSLKPLQALKPASSYIVKISPQLQAKNGTSLGHEVTVKFTTAGAAEESSQTPTTPTTVEKEQAAQKTNTTSGEKTSVTSSKDNADTMDKTEVKKDSNKEADTKAKPENIQVEDQKSEKSTPLTQKQKTNSYTAYLIAIVFLLLAALGYIYYKKRKKK